MAKRRFYVEEIDFEELSPQDWIHILEDESLKFLGFGADYLNEHREALLDELRAGNNVALYHTWRAIASPKHDDSEDLEEWVEGEYA